MANSYQAVRSGGGEPGDGRPGRGVSPTSVGPFGLLAWSDHFLVRAEMSRTRRQRWVATAICVGIPLLLALPAAFLRDDDPWIGRGILAFAAFWPLAMVLGATLSAAAAVLADRDEETAFQLVLTPVPGDAIAAAKILSRVRPYLWGVLAAAPLYLLASGADALSLRGASLSLLAFWPLRMLAPIVSSGQSDLTPAAVVATIFMVLADAGMVWSAAHWGACYAVWLGNLTGTMFYMLWRLFYIAVTFGTCFLACAFPMTGGHDGGPVGAILALFQGAVILGAFLAMPMRKAVRLTLEEFSRYDRLCDDDFRAGYFRRFRWGPPKES